MEHAVCGLATVAVVVLPLGVCIEGQVYTFGGCSFEAMAKALKGIETNAHVDVDSETRTCMALHGYVRRPSGECHLDAAGQPTSMCYQPAGVMEGIGFEAELKLRALFAKTSNSN